uniref:Uncharacterized protein n=1 Tax=Tanacetum cinerariifolium TaxID=118510 RepID=A0A699QSC5_TANCI|nr:hypothetical protein [Tanacetum cinerariifolium]
MLAVRNVAEEAEAQVPAQGDDVQEHDAEEVATDVVSPTPTSPSPSSPNVGTSQCVESSDDVENVFNQGRNIVDMDQDKGIELVIDQEKDAEVLGMQEDDTEVQEAVEIITTTKLMTEVVTAAATQKKDQIEMDAEYARKLQEEIDKEHEGVM